MKQNVHSAIKLKIIPIVPSLSQSFNSEVILAQSASSPDVPNEWPHFHVCVPWARVSWTPVTCPRAHWELDTQWWTDIGQSPPLKNSQFSQGKRDKPTVTLQCDDFTTKAHQDSTARTKAKGLHQWGSGKASRGRDTPAGFCRTGRLYQAEKGRGIPGGGIKARCSSQGWLPSLVPSENQVTKRGFEGVNSLISSSQSSIF